LRKHKRDAPLRPKEKVHPETELGDMARLERKVCFFPGCRGWLVVGALLEVGLSGTKAQGGRLIVDPNTGSWSVDGVPFELPVLFNGTLILAEQQGSAQMDTVYGI
jgi:hypothetical protein